MGVVNNRIDIDALAKSSGGGGGGGGADVLWQGNVTDTYKDIRKISQHQLKIMPCLQQHSP